MRLQYRCSAPTVPIRVAAVQRDLCPAWLGASGGRGVGGIVGPGVARVAAAHIGFHGSPRTAPEARQITGDLERPVGGREQFKRQGQAAVGDAWMRRETEQFLHADGEPWRGRAVIDDRMPIAGGGFEMGGGFVIEPAREVPGNERIKRRLQIIGADIGEFGFA